MRATAAVKRSAVAVAVLALATGCAQERPIPNDRAEITTVACNEEDGSGHQSFPCEWRGGANGVGKRYVLTMPICTDADISEFDIQHAQGHAFDLECEDAESLIG